jgi:hypothetical protein
MYSLALIIFVVSEKKAFEYFPIGKVLYKVSVFYADRKSKMATTAGHKLTLDSMGKYSNAFFSETTNMIKAKLYRNIFPIGSNVKLSPAVAAILNFIPEQKT